jgi:polysaccharide pyruvyl transferase WcaK-like protein
MQAMKVLVFGFYTKGNLGDEFFADIFRALFPDFQFTFTDKINEAILKDQDAVFFGGGSFLDQVLSIQTSALPLLKTKPIFYLGIGTEIDIHPIHLDLLKIAKLIVIRSSAKLDFLKSINPNVIIAPDLVYYQSLIQPSSSQKKIDKSVLILPNISVLPQGDAPHWKHMGWEYFKFEFAQFLDQLIDDKYQIKFFPMCKSKYLDDDWAATEIFCKMRHRKSLYLLEKRTETIEETINLFSQYETIITQRYHGIVLAEIAKVPCMTISHHDKLKNGDKDHLSFYGFNKDNAREKFNSVKEKNIVSTQLIKEDTYKGIKEAIQTFLLAGNNGAFCGDRRE